MPRIYTGGMDQRLTLQEPNASADAYGQRVPSWQDVATVWASVEDLRGTEGVVAGIDGMVTDHRIEIRWRDDVKPTWRLVSKNGAAIYEIRSIGGLNRAEGLVLGCNLRT